MGHEAARTGRGVGRASAELGRQVGRTSAELGREVGHEAAAAGRQVGRTSSRLAGQVRDATVTFWNDVIGAKEHKAERLRRENRELERKRGSPAERTKAEEAGG